MIPTDAVQVLQAALVVVGGLAVVLWRIPGECVCESCPKHTNERRMAKLRQVELQHDYQHKGEGFGPNTPDIRSCGDETCPRNKSREA